MRYLVLIAGLITSVLVNAQVRKHIKDSGNLINLVGSNAYGENSYLVVNLNNCVSGKNGYVNFAFNGTINYSKVIDKNLGPGQIIHLGSDNFAIGAYDSNENKFYLYKINSQGDVEWVNSMISDTVTSFNQITIASDSLGNIYAATYDYDSTRIYKFSPNGTSLFHKSFVLTGPLGNKFSPNDLDIIDSNRILLSGARFWDMGFVEFDSTGNLLRSRIVPYYTSGSHRLWHTKIINPDKFLVCGITNTDGFFISEYSYTDDSITYYRFNDTSQNQYSFYPSELKYDNNGLIVFGKMFYPTSVASFALYLDSAFVPIKHVRIQAGIVPGNYSFRDSLFLHTNGDIIVDSISNIQDCNSFQTDLPIVQMVTTDTSGAFHGGIISNSAAPVLVSVTDSSVAVTNVYECSTSEIYMNVKENLSENEVRLYPNPTSNILNIDLSEPKVYQGIIFNLSGEAMFQSDEIKNTIDISSFSPGLYFLQLSDGINYFTGKFVKE